MSLPFPDQRDPKSKIKKFDPKWDQIFLSNDLSNGSNFCQMDQIMILNRINLYLMILFQDQTESNIPCMNIVGIYKKWFIIDN